MVISPWKALLFIAGGTAAAAVAGYVTGAFDGVFRNAPPVVAALPENAAPAPGGVAPAAPEVPLPQTETPSEETTVAPADAGISPPTFDVLRVEKDGSVVIAGKSAPKANVEIINGTSVIAQTVSTGEGDFAVVLDEPLKPGDYQIVLRATTPSNVAATSVETALVSVPDSPAGEVLALVEEPGKPSKLITVPEGGDDMADLPEGEVAAAGSQGSETAVPAPAGEDVAVVDEPAVAAPGDGGSAQPAPAAAPSPESGDAAGEPVVASADGGKTLAAPAQGTGESAVDTAESRPAADGDAPVETPAGTAPSVAESPSVPKEEQAALAAPAGSEQEQAAPADDTGNREEQVALATPTEPVIEQAVRPAPETTAPAPSPDRPTVRVEAVEIEGRKVFVAGQASPKMVVRVYANEYLLGETVASEGGRFLIETERDLPVGDYIIRADLLDDGGRKVVARAAVPFQREEGESIAAVAPPVSEGPAVVAPAPMPEPKAAPAPAAEIVANEPSKRPTTGTERSPPAEQAASAPPAPGADAPVVAEKPAGQPATAPGPSAAQDVAAADPGPAKTPVAPTATTPADAPAQEKVAAADPAVSPGSGEPAEPAEITAPKLQSVQGAVIIRRGDTLWRISRRVYGRGVRYSTIYVANQDQIADPDRIWPGQVFRVPDKSTEGEAADLNAMGEQMTTTTVE
ncbi:LysM peptidoglycan-binding domain-containing protein [Aquibium sp. LZ166]|uniref:LysM peptidoglycan-binding domain-containing protein n=1 Tax=Aquibium pacificus TaxID=3153579 RepID=A0ABV3SS69_9HYPH